MDNFPSAARRLRSRMAVGLASRAVTRQPLVAATTARLPSPQPRSRTSPDRNGRIAFSNGLSEKSCSVTRRRNCLSKNRTDRLFMVAAVFLDRQSYSIRWAVAAGIRSWRTALRARFGEKVSRAGYGASRVGGALMLATNTVEDCR